MVNMISLLLLVCVAAVQVHLAATDCVGGKIEGVQPWNILIYQKTSLEWSTECLGTLISPTHVVTTARCATNVFVKNSLVTAASDLRLAAGKLFQDFSASEPNAQWRHVRDVIRHEQYDRGHQGGLNDVALLVANHSFELSAGVSVACVDWSGLVLPTPGDSFVGTAWLQWQNTSFRWLTSPQHYSHVTETACSAATQPANRMYLSGGKFCARAVPENTCFDIDGSGLFLRHNLWGLLSYRLSDARSGDCWTQRLAAFTRLADHAQWIRRHLTSTRNDTAPITQTHA